MLPTDISIPTSEEDAVARKDLARDPMAVVLGRHRFGRSPVVSNAPAEARAKRYEVVVGKQIMHGGMSNFFPAGKIVTVPGYNYASLKAQGLQMKELEDGD
jgi:hypothetical protein